MARCDCSAQILMRADLVAQLIHKYARTVGAPYVLPHGRLQEMTCTPRPHTPWKRPWTGARCGAPDLVLLFNSPISGVGMQIQPPIFNVALTAQISMVRLDGICQAWSTSSWSWLKGHRDI